MSTLHELPHIDDLALMSREALIAEAKRIALELGDIESDLHDAQNDIKAGLFVEPDWLGRVRYGRSIRRRLLSEIKALVHAKRREELGGDPLAIMHRRFLHGLLTALNRHPNRELVGELYATARELAESEVKECELCAMRKKSDDAQGSNGVTEHVDAQATKPPVMGDFSDGDLVATALAG